MLTKTDYLELLLKHPKPEETLFFFDRPILYTTQHNGANYLVSLADEDEVKQTESFLLVEYPEETYALLQGKQITPREFFTHPDNTVHLALIEYGPQGSLTLLSGEPYRDNQTIPDEYLPTPDAKWYN